MKIFVRFLQMIIIVIPIFVFFYLLNINIVPEGVFKTSKAVNEHSPYINDLAPNDRVEVPFQESGGDWAQKIIDDPAFFFVHPQRSFDFVEVEVRFKNIGVPIFELGVLADATTGAYDLQPIQNLIIDNSSWSRIESGETVLLQREKKFVSIDDFLTDLPDRSEIATYHYGLSEPYRLSDYAPNFETTIQEISLRGSHEFYTYIKNETLNYEFIFVDENFRIGDDEVSLIVTNEDNKVIGEISEAEDKEPSGALTIKILIPYLPEGVYKIQMKATDDIVFRSFATSQQKMVFLNHVWVSEPFDTQSNIQRSLSVVSNGTSLRFSTHLAEAVQTVFVDGNALSISQPFVDFNYTSIDTRPKLIFLENRKDLLIQDYAFFAFSEVQYFNPDPVRLIAQTDLDSLGINYIIANYISPTTDGEWVVGRVKFDLTKAAFEQKTWKFVFSLPTAELDDREFLLNSIDLKLFRDKTTFTEVLRKIKEYVF